MNYKSILSGIFMFAVACVAIILVLKNYNSTDFYQASLLQILTFILATIISIIFVQHRTDKRRKIDCIEHIIIEIQNVIQHNENIFSLKSDALMLQASAANKIMYIKDMGFPQNQKDIAYIYDEFQELRDLYGNHVKTEEDLESIENDLKRHKLNITTKCDKVRLSLYDL
ncbi:hypothetical protein [Lacrimispora sp. JR3]|uniref:hypothetical protein n=1 Tax=Lacrimispora sinapis TaxID=3111456 RepID=UPI0037491DD7